METMQFFKYSDENVRLIGRWFPKETCAVTTTTGAAAELAFYGKMAVLHFDLTGNEPNYPHLWIIADGGAKIEAAIMPYMRIDFPECGNHVIQFLVKSETEMYPRWKEPLVDKVVFKGFEAQKSAPLPVKNKKTIEFVGDSITEGVLIDASYCVHPDTRFNRVFQNDSTATYAYLTAELLGLEPIIMGYGAVGATKGGQGGVVKAALAYPYCYDGAENPCKSADYIVINHGANDRGASSEKYFEGMTELLDVVVARNPESKIVVLGAFCEAFAEKLPEFVEQYNQEHGTKVIHISSKGWIPQEPLHPLRDGHEIVAQNLAKAMKSHFSELEAE